jgi:hypothetical protein
MLVYFWQWERVRISEKVQHNVRAVDEAENAPATKSLRKAKRTPLVICVEPGSLSDIPLCQREQIAEGALCGNSGHSQIYICSIFAFSITPCQRWTSLDRTSVICLGVELLALLPSDQTYQTDDTKEGRRLRIEDLLARTVFYKVGHHASHNAKGLIDRSSASKMQEGFAVFTRHIIYLYDTKNSPRGSAMPPLPR